MRWNLLFCGSKTTLPSYREETGFERLDSILSSGPNWGRIAATVLAVIAIIGLSASA